MKFIKKLFVSPLLLGVFLLSSCDSDQVSDEVKDVLDARDDTGQYVPQSLNAGDVITVDVAGSTYTVTIQDENYASLDGPSGLSFSFWEYTFEAEEDEYASFTSFAFTDHFDYDTDNILEIDYYENETGDYGSDLDDIEDVLVGYLDDYLASSDTAALSDFADNAALAVYFNSVSSDFFENMVFSVNSDTGNLILYNGFGFDFDSESGSVFVIRAMNVYSLGATTPDIEIYSYISVVNADDAVISVLSVD
ncbi:hypothetical protein [Rubritalea sp.]|uniref:hypothetical protein n=1 Tax=Rubritalea sp. TaxID=2109375 RepID=UPI003EF54B6E